MKKTASTLIIALALFAFNGQLAVAQGSYDVVYQLYYELLVNPEEGDITLLRLSTDGVFDDRFSNCLGRLIAKFQSLALDHYAWCDKVYLDYQSRTACQQENEPAKMHHWLTTLRDATLGDVLWSDTLMGQAQIMGKRLVPPAQYHQIIQSKVPPLKSELSCN
jgi:hypothetical protein